MNKKAQSQIITTVLIILLVLAAIVIVWQVVSTTVQTSADTLTSQTACIGLNLEITDVSVATDILTIKVTRRAGGPDGDVDLIALVDGEVITLTSTIPSDGKLEQLESATLIHNAVVAGDYTNVPTKTEVGGSVDGVACEFLDAFP